MPDRMTNLGPVPLERDPLPHSPTLCRPWCAACLVDIDGRRYHASMVHKIGDGAHVELASYDEDGTAGPVTFQLIVSENVERSAAEVRRLAVNLIAYVDEVSGG